MSAHYHLAQLNIARMLAPLDDPLMADFVAQLEHINVIADRSHGFVWRLQTEEGDATQIRVFEDERMLVNLSVWISIDALRRYVYGSEHKKVLRDRERWFERTDGPSLVLWWIPQGRLPTIEEAKRRLELLATRGPTPAAFTFGKYFPPPQISEK